MVKSMTGFASQTTSVVVPGAAFSAQWEMKSVNGRGLDLKLRLPDWLDGLEPLVRQPVGAVVKRGSVAVTLKLARVDQVSGAHLNMAALQAAVDMVLTAETEAAGRGLGLAPITAADLLAMRGVVETMAEVPEPARIVEQLAAQVAPLVAAFDEARGVEGAALAAVIGGQVDQIESLTIEARDAAEARRPQQAEALRAAVRRVSDSGITLDTGRLEQELALIAVKTDVTEECDRLLSHVAAARTLLASAEPVGRSLDFLMQEFNREANTLCSKAQSAALTRIGLDLKTVIDQMREQVQNLE